MPFLPFPPTFGSRGSVGGSPAGGVPFAPPFDVLSESFPFHEFICNIKYSIFSIPYCIFKFQYSIYKSPTLATVTPKEDLELVTLLQRHSPDGILHNHLNWVSFRT